MSRRRAPAEADPEPAPALGSLWTTPAPTGPIEGLKVDESVTADDVRTAVAAVAPRAAAFRAARASAQGTTEPNLADEIQALHDGLAHQHVRLEALDKRVSALEAIVAAAGNVSCVRDVVG